eukprot:COSAG06_NODE_67664_length_251_cov_0.684211_1_plen_26_part_01
MARVGMKLHCGGFHFNLSGTIDDKDG